MKLGVWGVGGGCMHDSYRAKVSSLQNASGPGQSVLRNFVYTLYFNGACNG